MSQTYDNHPLCDLSDEIYEINLANGWFDPSKPPRAFGDDVALLHSEVSEAYEGYRNGDMANVAEELADVLIRLLDTAKRYDIDLDHEVAKKLEKNRKRGYRHGNKVV